MLDYIIVGFGLSGLSFVEQLEDHNKSFVVFENASQRSSRVAGGIYNPVILKRFTAAWNVLDQMEKAVPFYKNVEAKLGEQLVNDLPVLRRFNSVEEQNSWFEASDKPILKHFLSPDLIPNTNEALDIPFQYGKVKQTGKIEVEKMLTSYADYLTQKNSFVQSSFEHSELVVEEDCVVYKDYKAKNIVFTEGFGLKNNPFFNDLPLVGNKGEYLLIKCESLELDVAIKSSVFIIPQGNDVYKVGATYNNQDKTPEPTSSAREELIRKLDMILKTPYQIVGQVAGIRPTTKDRRPLVGVHPIHQNMYILNGLGSRGILIGPTIADQLYQFIENDIPLPMEMDIKRFGN